VNKSIVLKKVMFLKTKHSSIKNVILSDYWNISGLTATDEEQGIINAIEDLSSEK